MRPRFALLAASVLPLLLSGCVGFWTGAEDLAAPEFRLVDVDGVERNLTDSAGRYLLVDFMGTWCGPCQRSVGDLKALLDQYPELDILSVSSTDAEAQMRDFQRQYGVPWPMAVDSDRVVERFADATGTGTWLWPSYALVDPDGRIVFWNRGETLPATFAAAVEDATGTRAAVTSEVFVPAMAALGLGLTVPLSPFLLRTTVPDADTQADAGRRLRGAAMVGLVLYGLLAFLVVEAGRPLTGRVLNVAGLAAVAGLLALAWWRKKGTDEVQVGGKGLERDGLRWALSLHGNLLYVAAPVVLAVVLAAFRRTVPLESLVLMGALGAGVVVGLFLLAEGGVRARLRGAGDRVGWVAGFGLVVSAAWVGWVWLQ